MEIVGKLIKVWMIYFFLLVSAQGQFNFEKHVLTDSEIYTFDMQDIDGDNDIDIIASDTERILWYENDGSGNFYSHIISNEVRANQMFAKDVDGDFDIDIVSYDLWDEIAWYENDGQADFTEHSIVDTCLEILSIYPADLNNDQHLDILAVLEGKSKVVWYEYESENEFITHTITDTSNFTNFVTASDLDSDGDMDIMGFSEYGNQISWYENDGSENFSQHLISDSAAVFWFIDSKNLDGDGDIDILSIESYYQAEEPGRLFWYQNDGHQNFTRYYIQDSESANYPQLKDLDNDGDYDVLAASGFTEYIYLFENDGSGNFIRNDILTAPSLACQIQAGDLNNDGLTDILANVRVSEEEFGRFRLEWYENMGSVGIKEAEKDPLSNKFCLFQNYPNPFNPKTVISYQLPVASEVELAIYNILGQDVAVLVQKKQTPGYYQAEWNAANFASGVYFYQLKAVSFTQTKKLLLVK